MSFRAALRQRHLLPVASATLTSAAVLLQSRTAYAEDPSHVQKLIRKPIYDDPEPTDPASPSHTPPQEQQQSASTTSSSVLSSLFGSSKPEEPTLTQPPTPTDRLATQVKHARLALYDYSAAGEQALNAFLARTLRLERDFTASIASLAPPPQAREPVVPGLIYVLVAALGGSIVTRSRGILLRATVPLAFGLTAAYATLPHTMRNVEDLIDRYEDGYPEVKRVHTQLRERSQHILETGKAHTQMTVARGEEALSEARQKVEDWLRQGK